VTGRAEALCPVHRRAVLAAGLGLGALRPGDAHSQIVSPGIPQLWLEGVRFVSLEARILVQDTGDRYWRALRPPGISGDWPQASPNGLIRNDLDVQDPGHPSMLRQRVQALTERLLAQPPPAWSSRSVPNPAPYRWHPLMSQQERDATVSIQVQFYLRDISQDLVFPPPARVASVMLTEIVRYVRSNRLPSHWVSGPEVTVETVARSTATTWLLERLDATVTRTLEEWTAR
jgi:hypothetical protein